MTQKVPVSEVCCPRRRSSRRQTTTRSASKSRAPETCPRPRRADFHGFLLTAAGCGHSAQRARHPRREDKAHPLSSYLLGLRLNSLPAAISLKSNRSRARSVHAAADVIGTTRAGFSALVATIFRSPLCSDADAD